MRKTLKIVVFLFCAVIFFQIIVLIRDQMQLKENLIRLHVVANSDTQEDQSLKLRVKDAIIANLEPVMSNAASKSEAQAYLAEHLAGITQIAYDTIRTEGYDYPVSVSLAEEAFPTRQYDTFSLPAGVYDALRIKIGQAEGKNWWCVAFPTLCIPKTSDGFIEAAAEAGLDASVCSCLSETYNIRFFLLEKLGQLQIFLRRAR